MEDLAIKDVRCYQKCHWYGQYGSRTGNSGFNVAILNIEVNRYQFHATFADTITRHMAENTILSSNQFQASLKKPEFLQGQPGLEKSL